MELWEVLNEELTFIIIARGKQTTTNQFFLATCYLLCGKAAAAAKSLQSCPTLCDPMDCSPPGSSIHGIFQARVLERGAIAFSMWKCCCCCCCCQVAPVVSDSVRPNRWQPTRLPSPWDSPGKNTGVGCHFLLHVEMLVAFKCFPSSLQPHPLTAVCHLWSSL